MRAPDHQPDHQPSRAADGDCCEEFARTSRRGFLRGSLALGGAAAITTAYASGGFREVSYAASPAPAVIVVLSLRGAADGMSLVVPHGDPAYYAARPTIAVPKASLLAGDSMFGLHPKFAPLLPLWNAGKMAAIHATGMAKPNRSHFEAMEIVEDADPGSTERRGWINRLVGQIGSHEPVQMVSLGTTTELASTYGPEPAVVARRAQDVALPLQSLGSTWLARQQAVLDELWRGDSGPLHDSYVSALAAVGEFAPANASTGGPANGAVYPTSDLADILKDTAKLIRADVGAHVITIDQGDWDMHSSLGNLGGGRMVRNVDQLATALAAFFTDLGTLASKVTVVTISEFGRRLAENANNGLDHGYGNVMLVMGAGVRGGRYYGNWPGLGADKLIAGDLAVTTDYRSVLAEILRSRTSADVSRVFPGFTPATVGFMA